MVDPSPIVGEIRGDPMVARLRAWLERVPIEDPLDRRLAVTMQILCFGGIAWTVAAIAIAAARGLLPEFRYYAAILLVLLVPSLGAAQVLVRSGRFRLSLRVAVAGLTLSCALLFAPGLSRGAPFVRLMAIPLAVAALLLGRRAVWTTFATLVAALAVAALRDSWSGVEAPPAPEPLGRFAGATLTFLVLTIVLDRIGASLREALSSALGHDSERRASEARVRAVFAMSPDAINLTRADDGLYVEVNDGFTRMTGWRREEAVGRTSSELGLWAERTQRQALLDRLARGETVHNVEATFRRKDGSRLTGLISSRTVTIDGKDYLLSITRDVSDLKRAADDRAALQEQLRQAQKLEAIGRLAGGVAHDFNNVLTSILASAELLVQALPAGDPARADARQIQDDGRRAAELTRQLLTYARKQAVEPQVIRAEERARAMEKLLRRVIGESIALETSYGHDGWPIFVDPGQLEQVVLNLVLNARDAMPSGGRITLATANVALTGGGPRGAHPPPGDYVVLTVADEGVGISPEVLPHVFEPFYTTKGDRGTGLGLATCYGIVTMAGGTIAVDSAPGAGSRFDVYLPRAAARPAVPGEAEPPALYGTETVLLLEDDPGVRRLAVRSLSQLGYEVVEAGSASDAVAAVARHGAAIDCAVVDLVLPDADGRDAVAQALGGAHVPVLYVSGWAPDLAAGDEFLAKPYSPIELARRVRALLSAARPEAQRAAEG